jgi:peptidoglycan hydrolase-like protein with peptidoglycan-binding domain
VAYVPWKNYLNFLGTIPGTGGDDAVLTLKMLLRDLGHDNLTLNSTYDKPTEAIVRAIQRKNGIKPDGVVDDLTKILIYNEKKSFNAPMLSLEEPFDKSGAKKRPPFSPEARK